MNQYSTPKNEISQLIERVDALNCDAVFMVKRIRGAKVSNDLENLKTQYAETSTKLSCVILEIRDYSKQTLTLKTALRRVRYAYEYMEREFNTKQKKLQSNDASNSRATKIPRAALLAKFIINESLKLNQKYAPSEVNNRRVSSVPESAFTDSHKLAQILQNELSITDISEVNPLDGMDSLT